MYMCASMRESQKIDIYTLGFQPQITQNSELERKKTFQMSDFYPSRIMS